MIIGVILAILQIVGDITKADTLSPEYFKGVKKVINSVSVIVGPKEGDTPDRDKYKQVCCMPNLCQICTSNMPFFYLCRTYKNDPFVRKFFITHN